MSKNINPNERRRRQLVILYHFQDGLCCHCHKHMTMDFAHVTAQSGEIADDHATIEHTLAKAYKGPNEFCNFLAAHADCNNSRNHRYPSDELIAYHMEVHDRIHDAGEYPKHSRRAVVEQFVRPADLPEYEYAHRDEEIQNSPFAVLLKGK